MTQEEKAKAYDERLVKARKEYSIHKANNAIGIMDTLERVFPELKESEDERIREAVVDAVMTLSDSPLKTKMLSWLEKQGKNNMGISEATKQKLEDNLNKALEKETPESWNEFLDEQKPADIEKGANGNEREIPNSTWSKEDESKIKGIINTLEGLYDNAASDTTKILYRAKIDWLKSLKERHTWKPSEEQMDAIKDAIDYLGCNTKKVREYLMSLYEQLKKLREE